jgi:DNA-binding NarL/FixJ family response regulator
MLAVRDLAGAREVDVACPDPARVRFEPADREILRLAAAGLTSAEIGARLHLAPSTVKRHLRGLLAQLGVANRAAAVHAARRLGAIASADDPGSPPPAAAPPHAVRVLVAEGADALRAGTMVALRGEPWVAACQGSGQVGETLRIAERSRPHIALVGRMAGGGDLTRALTVASPGLRTLRVRENATAAAVRAACGRAATATAGAETRVSARERDVLRALVTGATNGEIAARLGLSPYTVKQHTSSIYRKLGVRNRAEAAARAGLA